MATPIQRRKDAPLALVVNVHSRKARRDPSSIVALESAFGDRGPFIKSKTASDLLGELQNLRRTNPSMIFICGGDGTLRQTLTHLLVAYEGEPLPPIAVLRGGTMNSVATSLEIYRTPVDQTRAILSLLDEDLPLSTVRRHLLQVNRYYGFIFGLGGFSQFIEIYSQKPDPTPWYAFKMVSKTVFSALVEGSLATSIFRSFSAHIWRDGQPLLQGGPITNLSAATVRHIGFNFKPYIGAEEPGGTFGLLIFRKSPRALLNHIHDFYRGAPVSDPNILQLPSKEILIKVEHPMRPMLDGDLLKPDREFLLKTGPALNFVVV